MEIVERKLGQRVEIEEVPPGTVIYFDSKYWLKVDIDDINVIDLATGAPDWIDHGIDVEIIAAKLYIE